MVIKVFLTIVTFVCIIGCVPHKSSVFVEGENNLRETRIKALPHSIALNYLKTNFKYFETSDKFFEELESSSDRTKYLESYNLRHAGETSCKIENDNIYIIANKISLGRYIWVGPIPMTFNKLRYVLYPDSATANMILAVGVSKDINK